MVWSVLVGLGLPLLVVVSGVGLVILSSLVWCGFWVFDLLGVFNFGCVIDSWGRGVGPRVWIPGCGLF